jgi:hypothetical protein
MRAERSARWRLLVRWVMPAWAFVIVAGAMVITWNRSRAPRDAGPAGTDSTFQVQSASAGQASCRSAASPRRARRLAVAARALIPNHRMSRDDLESVTDTVAADSLITGRYLLCAVNRGDTLDASDLSPAPLFAIGNGHSPYLISIRDEPGLRTVLDAGSRVDVWRGYRPLLSNVPVLAVLCRDETDARCAIVIDATEQDRGILAKQDTGSLRLLIRSIAP